jgi:hypothetical protein
MSLKPPAKPATSEPAIPVTSGESVTLPVIGSGGSNPAVGVQGVRRSERAVAAQDQKRRVTGYTAAEASQLFPKGGAAFLGWALDNGVRMGERRTEAEWAPLIEEFAARPIHGHRRGLVGGSHQPNAKDLR